jgi:LytS/YehU family sensor histidine kinase
MLSTLRSPYWICQLTGWGTVAVYWFYYSVRHSSIPMALLDVCISAAFMIAVTDVYRRVVHKRGWLSLPPARILPVVVVGYLVLVAVYMLQAYLTYTVKVGGPYYGSIALGALAGGSRYIAIWLLSFHLYHYARQAAFQRATIAEARLARLSNDLNPHFLFNALNGIRALTREDPARSRDAIDRLSALLRYSLTRSNQSSVPLSEEVLIIKEYLALEKIRLEERLTVHWELPEDYANCEIPPLSLHTLVDNAIKHGIASLTEGGTIHITLSETASTWKFAVHNPCPSISDAGVRSESFPDLHKSAGTGIKNLRQRLLLQYGKTASLDFQRMETSAIATLSIPL